MKKLLLRFVSTVHQQVLRHELRRALLAEHYRDLQPLIREARADISEFRTLEAAMLREMGVLPGGSPTQLLQALAEFGVSTEAFQRLPSSELSLPLEADLVLGEWLRESEELVERLRAVFNREGERCAPAVVILAGRAVQKQTSLVVSYKGTIHYLHLLCHQEGRGGEWKWHFEARGNDSHGLLVTLQNRYDASIVARLRGQAINHQREMLELKTYERATLAYPQELQKRIDELLAAFARWADPASKVRQWGSLLIGRPGTGKTTIGGLIGARRPADCTFLYFPAADVGRPDEITNVFKLARMLEPCILQIDDVDLIAGDRRNNAGKVAFTSALMEALDGLNESARIFIIMTSNDITKMEPAIVDRAGRVSNKLVFTGFGEVCGEMLASHATTFGLRLSRNDIDAVVGELKEQLKDFTPDEAKNVCQRLYLSYDGASITREMLKNVLLETAATFHSETASTSFLPVQKTNGRGHHSVDCD